MMRRRASATSELSFGTNNGDHGFQRSVSTSTLLSRPRSCSLPAPSIPRASTGNTFDLPPVGTAAYKTTAVAGRRGSTGSMRTTRSDASLSTPPSSRGASRSSTPPLGRPGTPSACFGASKREMGPAPPTCSVGSYLGTYSSFSAKGVAAISTEKRELGPKRAVCAAAAYLGDYSSLKTCGVASWGSTKREMGPKPFECAVNSYQGLYSSFKAGGGVSWGTPRPSVRSERFA